MGIQYTLRNWIEYGFKQVKNELGWHDYRLTDYNSIERWWELIFSVYLLVSFHADESRQQQQHHSNDSPSEDSQPAALLLLFNQHPHWELGIAWKSALNNLRLLLQPYWCWAWLEIWLQIFPVPRLKRGLHQLMDDMDAFRILPIPLL